MSPMLDEDSVKSTIRQILLTYWDPHDAARNPAAHGTYDHYIDPLIKLIQSGDEQEIIHFLQQREAETMCFPALGTRRLMPVAKKLGALRHGMQK
jgi:hypothetical protein